MVNEAYVNVKQGGCYRGYLAGSLCVIFTILVSFSRDNAEEWEKFQKTLILVFEVGNRATTTQRHIF